MTYLQAIIIGLVQGATELFPVSSLGHAVLIPSLLGWNLNVGEPFFLSFLVATHFATATVLFVMFWEDWKKIITGLARSATTGRLSRRDSGARLGVLLAIGTVPAGLLGLLLEKKIRALLVSPALVASFLIANGLLLFACEWLRGRAVEQDTAEGSDRRIAELTMSKALGVGLAQALALIPGFSRSGMSMGGGLLAGLSNEDAARFSFLLATPIIGAASLLELPKLFAVADRAILGPAIVGALFAALGAYLSTRFLLRFFEKQRLTAFAVYCVLFGGATLAYLLVIR